MSNCRFVDLVEAVLLTAGKPVSIDQLMDCFKEMKPAIERQAVKDALSELHDTYEAKAAMDLVQVSSGYRIQCAEVCAPYLNALYQEKPQKYGRALLETLAIIAYRQPITRGDIEEVRGVAVSPNVIRTLLDRGWIKVIGHRDVPGRPAIMGTTRGFLDDFNLKSLDGLPALSEIRDLSEIAKDLTEEFDFSEGTNVSENDSEQSSTDSELLADESIFVDSDSERAGASNSQQEMDEPGRPILH